MNRRTSESSLVREQRQFLSFLVRKHKEPKRTTEMIPDLEYIISKESLKELKLLLRKKKKLNEDSFINVLVYEWAHLWKTTNYLISMFGEVEQKSRCTKTCRIMRLGSLRRNVITTSEEYIFLKFTRSRITGSFF